MPVEQQPPDVLAMVLADGVLRDAATGKHFIQGTYAAIFAPEFPWHHPAIVVYVAITNGHGKTPVKMRLVDVDETHDPVFEEETVIDFPDPLTVAELTFVRHGTVFPAPGEYRLQLFGAGQPLKERRIQVMPPPGAEGD
jgi:hypothetical protein